MLFLPEEVDEGQTAAQAAIVSMPGAFGFGTTQALLTWVRDRGYENGEHFQKFLADRISAGIDPACVPPEEHLNILGFIFFIARSATMEFS